MKTVLHTQEAQWTTAVISEIQQVPISLRTNYMYFLYRLTKEGLMSIQLIVREMIQ